MEHIDFNQINSRSKYDREKALEELTQVSPKYALLAARAGITDLYSGARRVSADVIGEYGSKLDRYRLVGALNDEDWAVRSSAILALGSLKLKIGDILAFEILSCDKHFVVRRDTAIVLSKISDQPDQILRSALRTEKHPIVRNAIQLSLYLLGERSLLKTVLDDFRHEDDLVRNNAVNGFVNVAVFDDDKPLIAEALKSLIALETNPGNAGDARAVLKLLMR